MKRYKVLAGYHYDDNGDEYKKDDIIESAQELDKLFRNKFECLGDVHLPKIQPEDNSDEKEPSDVTSNYPKAKEAGLVVVSKGGNWFDVFDEDDLETPLNEKSLRPKGVDDFLAHYTE